MREGKKPAEPDKPVRGTLLTVKEAAEYIHAGKDSIYNLLRAGKLPFPFYRLLCGIRIDSADLDEWLLICKVPAGNAPGKIKEAAM